MYFVTNGGFSQDNFYIAHTCENNMGYLIPRNILNFTIGNTIPIVKVVSTHEALGGSTVKIIMINNFIYFMDVVLNKIRNYTWCSGASYSQ